MKRSILFSCLLVFITLGSYAHNGIGLSMESIQKKKGSSKFDKSRLFVGGGLNAGGLPGGFLITAVPSVGYAFTDRLHAGISIGGTYFSYSPAPSLKENGMNYQAAIFARYFVLNTLFLQIRPEYNNTKFYDNVGNPGRLGIPSFLVGAGYAQRIGGISYAMFSVMYDLVQNPNSQYYRQPIFGGGIALGIFGGR